MTTRDDIIRMAREAGFVDRNVHADIIVRHSSGAWVAIAERLERFASLVAAAEREECAKEGWMAASGDCQDKVSAAIRARGQQ